MDASTRAPGYDLFKLIVAIFLLILAILLIWMSPSRASTLLPPTGTALAALATATTTPTVRLASPTTAPLSPTPPPLTVTASSTPTPTETPVPEPTATPSPSPTATPTVAATPTPTTKASVAACEAATSRSHLQVGKSAAILRRLNLRSSPGIRNNWLLTNLPGTHVQVVGGPECVPYQGGAYLWWQIQLPDGRLGWSAESSLHGSFYFMEPK